MTRLINTIKAALIPQPPVIDRETVELQTLWRSIFMQGDMGDGGMPEWKVIAEVERMKHQSQGVAV